MVRTNTPVLRETVRRWVAPESIVHVDLPRMNQSSGLRPAVSCWDFLKEDGFRVLEVSHDLNNHDDVDDLFFNPETGACINSIECVFPWLKRSILPEQRQRGYHSNIFSSTIVFAEEKIGRRYSFNYGRGDMREMATNSTRNRKSRQQQSLYRRLFRRAVFRVRSRHRLARPRHRLRSENHRRSFHPTTTENGIIK
jgi:hypothetical protein